MIIAKMLRKVNPTRVRLYIDNMILNRVGLSVDSRYNVQYETDGLRIDPSEKGDYKVSRKEKGGKVVPVLDKENLSITEMFKGCSNILVAFYEKDGQAWIRVTGEKEEKPSGALKGLTFLSFCSGAGLSSRAFTLEGFKDRAFNEYNFKGDPERYASIYLQNNPDSIMLNVPMQMVKGEDLPGVDVWLATLDCTCFSSARRNKRSAPTGELDPEAAQSKGLFFHLWRLANELPADKRPKVILIENVSAFAKVAGEALKIGFEALGYHHADAVLDSSEFGSRTRRKRYLLALTQQSRFVFPEPTGAIKTAIAMDGVITNAKMNWLRPEDSETLRYFLERHDKIKAGEGKNNFIVTTVDLEKDTVFPTVSKTHLKRRPEGIVKHPTENLYAWVEDVEMLRYLHEIDASYDLGDSRRVAVEAIGQGVSVGLFRHVAMSVRCFLERFQEQVEAVRTPLEPYGQLSFLGI